MSNLTLRCAVINDACDPHAFYELHVVSVDSFLNLMDMILAQIAEKGPKKLQQLNLTQQDLQLWTIGGEFQTTLEASSDPIPMLKQLRLNPVSRRRLTAMRSAPLCSNLSHVFSATIYQIVARTSWSNSRFRSRWEARGLSVFAVSDTQGGR